MGAANHQLQLMGPAIHQMPTRLGWLDCRSNRIGHLFGGKSNSLQSSETTKQFIPHIWEILGFRLVSTSVYGVLQKGSLECHASHLGPPDRTRWLPFRQRMDGIYHVGDPSLSFRLGFFGVIKNRRIITIVFVQAILFTSMLLLLLSLLSLLWLLSLSPWEMLGMLQKKML